MTKHIDTPENGNDNQLGAEGMAEAKHQYEVDREKELLEEYKTENAPATDDGLGDGD